MKLSNKISTSFLIFNIVFIMFFLFYIEYRNSSELDSHCLENIYSDEIENILKSVKSKIHNQTTETIVDRILVTVGY